MSLDHSSEAGNCGELRLLPPLRQYLHSPHAWDQLPFLEMGCSGLQVVFWRSCPAKEVLPPSIPIADGLSAKKMHLLKLTVECNYQQYEGAAPTLLWSVVSVEHLSQHFLVVENLRTVSPIPLRMPRIEICGLFISTCAKSDDLNALLVLVLGGLSWVLRSPAGVLLWECLYGSWKMTYAHNKN